MTNNNVLSDVHLEKVATNNSTIQYTRFKFYSKLDPNIKNKAEEKPEKIESDDDDDDLKVTRDQVNSEVIGIHHKMSTGLDKVGCQVWLGALLLCDYVTENSDVFSGQHVLELGSGTGLLAVVLSQFVESLCCTDYCDEILNLCRRNLKNNKSFDNTNKGVSVQKLDWLADVDYEKINRNSKIIVAADCFYDCQLTKAFFKTLLKVVVYLLEGSSKRSLSCYFSIEKRLNFCASELKIVSKEYDDFTVRLHEFVDELKLKDINCSVLKIENSEFNQYFSYQKTKFLELWKVSISN